MTDLELIKIDNLEEYIKFTDELSEAGWWFRGQPCASLELLPGLYRDGIHRDPKAELDDICFPHIHNDRKIINEYREYLKFTQPNISFIQAMFRAQHYGIKTRLLDFTVDPKVALFFAIENPIKNNNCDFEEEDWNKAINPNYVAVWCLKPEELNDISQLKKVIFSINELSEKIIYSNQLPVAINPDLIDKRISTQSGRFVLFGTYWKSLEWFETMRKNTILKKILIKKDLCRKLFKEMYDSGFTYRSIYPDEEGFAKDLNYELMNSLIGIDELAK